jgi:GntR family transcriptional repressor for pyruvate dehydrogenase complex
MSGGHREAVGAWVGAIEPVSRGERLADKVARAIAESILAGQLAIGERLPSERELRERFEVSRPVIREAVRSLKAKGLLADHPRRGHVVTAFGRDAVTESLIIYLRGQRFDYTKLIAVRRLIEIENAGLAAEHASPEQVAALCEAAPRLAPRPNVEQVAREDVAFHSAVAAATGNEFLAVLLDSIRETLIVVQQATLVDPNIVAVSRRAHEQIAAQIAARNPAGARRAMQQHLMEARQGVEALVRAPLPRAAGAEDNAA